MQEGQQWFLSLEWKSIPMLPYQTCLWSSYEQPVVYQCKQVWIPLPIVHSDFSCRLEICRIDGLFPKLLGARTNMSHYKAAPFWCGPFYRQVQKAWTFFTSFLSSFWQCPMMKRAWRKSVWRYSFWVGTSCSKDWCLRARFCLWIHRGSYRADFSKDTRFTCEVQVWKVEAGLCHADLGSEFSCTDHSWPLVKLF